MSTPASALSKTNAVSVSSRGANEFAADVRTGLSKPQKELHSKYFYDDLGSALFEAITYLPEYGLTRADERLLHAHASSIASLISAPCAVIELGSGTGKKTRSILTALQPSTGRIRFYPIDVSADALARCAHDLADVAEVHALEQSYLDGLATAIAERKPGESLLVLFLGSTIGNFERPCAAEFLRSVSHRLQTGDALLVGADLVKDRERMLAAYDDPSGLTAVFNLNVLGRINRELGADFELRNFEHQAIWNELERRIEMHLRSRKDQTVSIAEADLIVHFQSGETIWTESSHKFHLPEMQELASQTGFHMTAQWVDQEWPFVESLWTVR
jgi:L-histidine N-alpha-methyltransferase